MAPRGQQSERRLATTTRDDSEANWNRRTGGQADAQDHVLSQADALTKKAGQKLKQTILKEKIIDLNNISL